MTNLIKFNRSIFLDSSNIKEIEKWNSLGIIDGVTTNQTIMLKDGVKLREIRSTIKTICKIMKGKPVSVELTDSTSTVEQMINDANIYREIANNVVVKVPMIPSQTKSLEVIKKLLDLKISVNATVLMTFEQLVIAALAVKNHPFPSFISLFWCRSIEDHEKYRTDRKFVKDHPLLGTESDINSHPGKITSAIIEFLNKGGYDNPKLIIGSIRKVSEVGECFKAGAHIATIPPSILQEMLYSKRTEETNIDLDKSWITLKSQS